MTKRIAIAAIVAALAACGSNDKCPTQSPKLSEMGTGCVVRPGTAVSYPLRLCPTCNQSGATCSVDMSAVSQGEIFLDPTVEACTSGTSCGPATCDTNPFSCTFTAPTVEGDYHVTVVNGDTNTPVTQTLTVSSTLSPSCSNLQPI